MGEHHIGDRVYDVLRQRYFEVAKVRGEKVFFLGSGMPMIYTEPYVRDLFALGRTAFQKKYPGQTNTYSLRSDLRRLYGPQVQKVLAGDCQTPADTGESPRRLTRKPISHQMYVKQSGTGCRYVVMPLADHTCIIDLCPNDEVYIVRSSRGEVDYIQKEIYAARFDSPEAAEIPAMVEQMNAPYRHCESRWEIIDLARQLDAVDMEYIKAAA